MTYLKGYHGTADLIFSEQDQFAIFTPRKTGSTSIAQTIGEGMRARTNVWQRNLVDPRMILDYTLTTPGWDQYIAVAFVREPISRLMSGWYDRVYSTNCAVRVQEGIHEGQSFPDFVDSICGLPDEAIDRHFASQSFTLMRGGKVLPNYLLRFSHMPEDWEWFRSMARMKPSGYDVGPLKHYRKSIGKPEALELLTAKQVDRVHERFAMDYTLYEAAEIVGIKQVTEVA